MQRNNILVCFLIIFLAFSFVSLVYAVYIFTDGEVGSNQEVNHNFATWTGTGGMTVVAISPHHGSYSFLSDGSGDYAYKSFTATDNFNMRVYVNFTSLPIDTQVMQILRATPTAGSDLYAGATRTAGQLQWRVVTQDGTSATADATFTTGVWYCVELQWVRGTKTATVYIDGENTVSKASATDSTIYRSFIGSDGNAFRGHFDCVVINAGYIGVEGGVTSYTFQGNFNPTFTFGSSRTWSFSNQHTFTVSFGSSLNRFVNLNTQNTLGFAFTLNQLRTWQFTSHRTIPFQLALNSIQNFAYSLPGLLTFYGDITATFTMKALKEAGFTTEQTIPFTLGIQSATTILQLGVLTIWSTIGFTFQTLSSQYGLAEITLDYAFALAGLAFILAITGITITLVRRKGD